MTDEVDDRPIGLTEPAPQRDAQLRALAGGVAHELGNVLVGVLANAGMLVTGLDPSSAEAAMARDVLRSAERAADLAGEMRAYAGAARGELQAVTLEELAREVRAQVEASLGRSTRLHYQLDGDVPPILGDAAQLRRMLANLLRNASEALDGKPGEVVMRARLAPVNRRELLHDHLPGNVSGSVVHIEVQDDGVGMTADHLRQIFDPFFTTKSTSRGLGLSAVLGIVRAHGGGIRVESAPARGTTFGLIFPPYQRPAVPASPAVAPPGGLVLVVDDEPLVRRAVRRILQPKGFTIIDAADGPAGLELVDKHPELRAVILDVTMPGMSGLEVLEQIRARRPPLAVLMSSALTDLPAGIADGFLAKPYGPKALLALLRAAIAAASTRG